MLNTVNWIGVLNTVSWVAGGTQCLQLLKMAGSCLMHVVKQALGEDYVLEEESGRQTAWVRAEI